MPDMRILRTLEYGEFSRRVHDQSAATSRVIKAQVELTYRCNLHCRHCYTDPYNAKEFAPRELSLDEIYRLLEELQQIGVMWLNLTGGDIFMHPHFFDIYDRAVQRGFLLQLYTNGTLFTQAAIERLRHTPPFTIDISCHSVSEDAFDWFTQVPGSFRAFVRGLEMLRAAGLPFTLKTKAMNWNKDEMPAIRRFVESYGGRFGFTHSLSPRLDGDLAPLGYRLAPDDVLALDRHHRGAEEAEDVCALPPGPAPPATDRLYRCGCGTNTIHINAWGELGTCTLQYERRRSLREQTLREAIDSLFREIRAMRYRGVSPCRTCNVYAWCEKKPTDARWECGNAEAPIPYNCDVAVGRAETVLRRPLIHPLRASSS